MNSVQNNSIKALVNEIQVALLKKDCIVVSLDGRSGVGKSTLAALIASDFDCSIIHCDDFYSGAEDDNEANWHNKSPQEKINQVINYDRLKNEVLTPLLLKKEAKYHPFNFETGKGLSNKTVKIAPALVVILDGVYSSLHLKSAIDISVLIDFPDDLRRSRLLQREGKDFMQDWHSKWDSAENYYFNEVMTRDSFDFVIDGNFDLVE